MRVKYTIEDVHGDEIETRAIWIEGQQMVSDLIPEEGDEIPDLVALLN